MSVDLTEIKMNNPNSNSGGYNSPNSKVWIENASGIELKLRHCA